MIKSLNEILEKVKELPKNTIAVAQAADHDILAVAERAISSNLADFIFIGNPTSIRNLITEGNYNLKDVPIVESYDDKSCAQMAVELVTSGKADMPMKGLLSTATFMRAVLDKQVGLRTDSQISQITLTDNIDNTGLYFITDCAMNVAPDINEKISIVNNAVFAARKFGYECPNVALITAIETVNPNMQETIDAAVISKMNDRGQIKNCKIDGPFALDNAISKTSAEHKGVSGPVAGNADILVVSDIKMGNVLHKAITYIAKKRVGSVIIGTKKPLVMTSRSDSIEDKLISIAASSYLNNQN
ncbi:phosphate acyltransferase [Gudongella sp. DL1XJH-153]|uniref:phosphate acyltransferase n=1 Tax=Gudongella sp. DL1XJH-153 TaxID=3409804 RepID=UPI003BB7FCB0